MEQKRSELIRKDDVLREMGNGLILIKAKHDKYADIIVDYVREYMRIVKRRIEDIATESDPREKWIPCAERLPEYSGRYLVTRERDGKRIVDWNIYYYRSSERFDGWMWEPVSAWMPLPEPYKGGKDERSNQQTGGD